MFFFIVLAPGVDNNLKEPKNEHLKSKYESNDVTFLTLLPSLGDNVNSVLQEFAGRRLDDELLTVMSSVSIVEGIVVLLSIA